MEQLPKIAAQRLQAVSRAETHPDANLLTGFAEKSLLPREQAQILEHLAACAECRDVVAHAQPEEVMQRAVAAPPLPVGRSWLSGATIRWAALAACVVVVGGIVISRTQFKKQEPGRIATYTENPQIVAKAEPQVQSAPVTPSEEKDTVFGNAGRLKNAPENIKTRDADQLAEANKQRASNIAVVNGAVGEQRQADKGDLVAENNSPSSFSDAVTVTSAAPAVSQQQEDAKSSKKEFSADKAMKAPAGINEVARAQAGVPAPPSPPAAKPATTLADAQPGKEEAEPTGSFYKTKDGYIAGEALGTGALAGMNRITPPMWQLSADGKLIKSLDHGQNWQPVPVGEHIVFRALSVTGHEIWIGGIQGNLFYSSNAGQQWEQVKPVSKGQTLTADITAIEFKDSKHGKVTTADHQIWTTNDGGHDWKLESR